jgi:hypothetical protein
MTEPAETDIPAVPADQSHPAIDNGDDTPEVEPADPLAQTFDAVIMGTGVIESIVAGYAIFAKNPSASEVFHHGNSFLDWICL